MFINSKTIGTIISIFIFLSFILGYCLNENSAGGGQGDYNHIANNYNLIFSYNFSEIDWSNYESTRFPLHYFLVKLYVPFNYKFLSLNTLFVSLIGYLFLVLIILKKNNYNQKKIDNVKVFLLSSIILLSPYFRTSAYWMLEENFGISLIITSYFFIYHGVCSKKNYYIYFGIFISYLAFFCSQNLFIFVMTNFFYLMAHFKKNKKNLFNIVLINLIFISPLIIFFDHIVEIMSRPITNRVNKDILDLNYYNLISVFSILLFYAFPFVAFDLKKNTIFKNINYKAFSIYLFSFFVFIYIFKDIEFEYLAGGVIKKIIYLLPLSEIVKKYLILSSAFVGLIFLLELFKKYRYLGFFIIFYSILFIFTDYVFQEYFDPIFVLFLIFYCLKLEEIKLSQIYFLIIYFSSLLVGAIFYYKNII